MGLTTVLLLDFELSGEVKSEVVEESEVVKPEVVGLEVVDSEGVTLQTVEGHSRSLH